MDVFQALTHNTRAGNVNLAIENKEVLEETSDKIMVSYKFSEVLKFI